MPTFSVLIFYGCLPDRAEGNLSFELEFEAASLQKLAARSEIASLGKLLLGNGPFEVNGGLTVEVSTKDPVQLRNAASHCALVMESYYNEKYETYCAELARGSHSRTLPIPRNPPMELWGLDTNEVFDLCTKRLALAKALDETIAWARGEI